MHNEFKLKPATIQVSLFNTRTIRLWLSDSKKHLSIQPSIQIAWQTTKLNNKWNSAFPHLTVHIASNIFRVWMRKSTTITTTTNQSNCNTRIQFSSAIMANNANWRRHCLLIDKAILSQWQRQMVYFVCSNGVRRWCSTENIPFEF